MNTICEKCGDTRQSIPKRTWRIGTVCENIRACNARKIKADKATPHTCNIDDRREGQSDADCPRCQQIMARRK